MAKCIKCGTELIYIESDNVNYCPKCGAKYKISSSTEPHETIEQNIQEASGNKENSTEPQSLFEQFKAGVKNYDSTNVGTQSYDSMSVGPTVGAVLSLVIYIICLICQFTSSNPIGVISASIFSAIASIAFSVFLVFAIIYRCIDKYHMQTVAPMQDEIAELKKEIENLKKEIKQ